MKLSLKQNDDLSRTITVENVGEIIFNSSSGCNKTDNLSEEDSKILRVLSSAVSDFLKENP